MTKQTRTVQAIEGLEKKRKTQEKKPHRGTAAKLSGQGHGEEVRDRKSRGAGKRGEGCKIKAIGRGVFDLAGRLTGERGKVIKNKKTDACEPTER